MSGVGGPNYKRTTDVYIYIYIVLSVCLNFVQYCVFAKLERDVCFIVSHFSLRLLQMDYKL